MRLSEAMQFGMTHDYNPKQVNPALLTFAEYHALVNAGKGSHPDSAYTASVTDLNQGYPYQLKSNYPRLIQQLRLHGLSLQLRLSIGEPLRYVKTDADGEIVRVNGLAEYFSPEESIKLGLKQHHWSLAVFDGETLAGLVHDEWGCLLVQVANEYQGLGLGPVLVKTARTIEPQKPSGGFTAGGYRNFQKVYRDFVGDALRTGLYRALIAQGELTVQRVKAIVQSLPGARRPAQPQQNFATADSRDWRLLVDPGGTFILYDRKLKDLINNTEREHFVERMIIGMVDVSVHDHHHVWAALRAFGGDTDNVKRLMMRCAIEYARREAAPLYIEPEDVAFVDPRYASVGPVSKRVGFSAHLVSPTGVAVPYDTLGQIEATWRRGFDRYGELHDRLLEMAFGKFQPSG